MVFILSILAAGGAFAKTRAPAETKSSTRLSLEDYLQQVAKNHSGIRAADLAASGARLTAEEGALIFRPSLFGSGSSTALGTGNPFSNTEPFQSHSYTLGLSEATRFGLTGKLSVNRSETIAKSSALSGEYYANWTELDLNQSLWRGWAGRELEATAEAMQFGQLASAFQQSYLTKTLRLEAEANYWRLALAREVVTVEKDALDRAQRTADWANRREHMQLADRAEALQASGALQARRLELQNAEDEVTSAAQAFNSSRGINSSVVSETLIEISAGLADSLLVPARTQPRDDVKAAEMAARASAASAQLSREKNKPTVDLFASIPLTKPDDPTAAFASIIPYTSRASTTVGIKATIPLDLSTESKIREGYDAQASAAGESFKRKAFEEERDWSDLTTKFSQAKQRLKLYEGLEKTQREKLLYERDRQTRGRTTLQSVLIYEGDYQNAQLGRIQTLAQLLTLNAQMKLYGVSYESR